MVSVYDYMDYRKYLKHWFEGKKHSSPTYSYGAFAGKAGFADKGFLNNVIHGRRALTKESLTKVSRAIGHTKTEAEYFESLVYFNRAKTLKDRVYYHEKLLGVKGGHDAARKALLLRKDQYDYCSRWYHSAIRSLIDMYPFKGDFHWLAKKVYPSITPSQARKSVALLERLDLVRRDDEGVYALTSKSITTGSEVRSLAAQCFHRDVTGLALNALDCVDPSLRNITGLTMGISEATYHTICEELRLFRARLVALVEADDSPDRTYQLNLHLFPVTSVKPRDNRTV